MATRMEAINLGIATPEDSIARFDIHQIIQHIGLMVSFVLLVITGVPLKFHDWAISQAWIGMWGGIEVTRSIHYFGAWLMVGVGLYHLYYLWYSTAIAKKPFPVKMLPSLQDLSKFVQELGYYIGLRKEMPRYDRFNWKEKFDYWALFWGVPVMAISGFIMMFPVSVTRFLPGWVVPTALVAHSDEAMLALTWIVMVHIFFNHFTPGVFPLNTSIFSGRVPADRYRRDHPMEYNRLMGIPEVVEEKPAKKGAGKDDIDEKDNKSN